MEFDPPLVRGILRDRYKRFICLVEMGGQRVEVFCPNSGSMKGCLAFGRPCYVEPANRPGRRLKWTLKLTTAEDDERFLVSVDTGLPVPLLLEGLESGMVGELSGYPAHRREVKVGGSRLDLLLGPEEIVRVRGGFDPAEFPPGTLCFIEAKNVTMTDGRGTALFPDAVTTRGQKHLRELMEIVRRGQRAVNFYLVGRGDAECFSPADQIDPDYGHLFRQALAAGVEMVVWQAEVTPQLVRLVRPLPVEV